MGPNGENIYAQFRCTITLVWKCKTQFPCVLRFIVAAVKRQPRKPFKFTKVRSQGFLVDQTIQENNINFCYTGKTNGCLNARPETEPLLIFAVCSTTTTGSLQVSGS